MTTRTLTPHPQGFHGDKHLLRLVDLLARRSEVFLETGSNVGSTLGYVARRYPGLQCLACEPDPDAHAVAERHACTRPGVEVHRETAQEFLRRIAREHEQLFSRPVLAWLDAHGYGYEWPLHDEVRFLTERCERAWILIDDFRVPHDARFGWDEYGEQQCSFEYVADSIAEGVAWRLYYPAYSEHTSPWHPLRGWGLLQVARDGRALEALELELPDVCLLAATSGEGAASRADADHAAPRRAFEQGDLPRAIALLRTRLDDGCGSATDWNDLGVCLVHSGSAQAGLEALGQALRIDPGHADARLNLVDVLMALHSDAGRTCGVAPEAIGHTARRNPLEDARALLGGEATTIVDAGNGSAARIVELRRLFPASTIHAFEPRADLACALRERFEDDLRLVVHCALPTAEGALLLQAADGAWLPQTGQAAAARHTTLGLPLSEVVSGAPALLVLGHTPGVLGHAPGVLGHTPGVLSHTPGVLSHAPGTLDALRGLGPALEHTRLVLCSVDIAAPAPGSESFGELDASFRAQGFRLVQLYDPWTGLDGHQTTARALYQNVRYFA